jgi:glycosyltransferase involved in cell wall biosynthesis
MSQAGDQKLPRIFTSYAKSRHPRWMERVTLWEEWDAEIGKTWAKPISLSYRLKRDLIYSWKLFEISKDYDVIITGSDHSGLFFALLQKMFRRQKKPHIFVDWLVELHHRPIGRTLRRLFFRWVINAASCALVQTTKEINTYSEALKVLRDKFVFIPYHATMLSNQYSIVTGNYIFSGGDTNRDYATLIEAVRGIPAKVVIAALYRHHFNGIGIPENVEVLTVSAAEFVQLMAGSLIVVVPMKKGFEHSGGQQTYINAMSMAKPVVVADDTGAEDYIQSGVTGLVVPSGDPEAMRSAIAALLQNPELAAQMGQEGRKAATEFTPERFFEKVFAISYSLFEASRAEL